MVIIKSNRRVEWSKGEKIVFQILMASAKDGKRGLNLTNLLIYRRFKVRMQGKWQTLPCLIITGHMDKNGPTWALVINWANLQRF